ncbi:MAG TPA: hypothetical protein ENN10_05925 [Actinobacteria bacterium]|nr:hypothetical protein [Actinomycetota bacterium]
MTEATTVLGALLQGVRFGLEYNPLLAVITVAVSAALAGRPRLKASRHAEAAGIVGVGWLVGDGLRILGHARDLHDGLAPAALAGAPEWAGWLFLGGWALISLVVGYLGPALVGAAVGRRVTHGTGWLAAAGVGVALTVAISAGAGALG